MRIKKKKYDSALFKHSLMLLVLLLVLTGCSAENKENNEHTSTKEAPVTVQAAEGFSSETASLANAPLTDVPLTETPPADTPAVRSSEPTIVKSDWSGYFDGMNGAAVIYDPDENQYMIYNQDLAETRRSPCSTFKIISSLIALENGIIEPDDSVRKWSGETFWNENWNKDIGFQEAFRTSCVWYYRQIIDEIGEDRMQAGLNELSYGNCDSSDWEGRLNTNNNNRALTGFWIESSLKISAKEQTEVMERIFGRNTHYGRDTLNRLKQVMLIAGQDETGCLIYGKTGMGKDKGVVVDSWFTGFVDTQDGNRYFCVYLGRTDGKEVSSTKAKEIAASIVTEVCRDL